MHLITRYDHISRNIDEARAREQLAEVNNVGFEGVLTMLDDIGTIVGADAVFTDEEAVAQPRFGLTLVIPERDRPLIWLNLRKHKTLEELVDTVVHEAVHATVRVLNRRQRTPQPEEAFAYLAEEIVALAATNLILRRIEFPALHQIARNMIGIDRCKNMLGRLGCDAQFLGDRFAEAEAAAAFFTETLIHFGPPNEARVRARRPAI